MTQTTPRYCTNCGTSVSVGERFCSNCGTAVASDTNSPTLYSATVPAPAAPSNTQNSNEPNLPPPPPPETLLQAPQQVLQQPPNIPYTPSPTRSSSYYSSPAQQGTPPLPDYARVQKRSPLRRLISFVIFLLILALLIAGILLLVSKF